MLYQVTIRKEENFHEHRAEATSAAAVRLYYRKNNPDAEVIDIQEAQAEAKPGQDTINIELPLIVNIYRLHNGYILVVFEDGSKCRLCPSERDGTIELLKAIQEGEISATDEAKKEAREISIELEIEAEQSNTYTENRARCERIAQELEKITAGDVYRCPHCGELHDMAEYEDSEHENEDGETLYTCPHCGEDIDEYCLEAVTISDYLDECFDIEYVVDGDKEYRCSRICVACGGPNIYIDTDEKAVRLYWWGDSAQYPLSGDAVDAVDDWARDIFNY